MSLLASAARPQPNPGTSYLAGALTSVVALVLHEQIVMLRRRVNALGADVTSLKAIAARELA